MDTLIIHPADKTTDFLKPIYQSIQSKTVITGGLSTGEVLTLIDSHDRVIMMGHGSPRGLFSVGVFYDLCGYVIDKDAVSLLKEKKGSIFIWCDADQFIRRHKLNGFSTGMFISEIRESVQCGLKDITQEMVDESNNAFGKILNRIINNTSATVYKNLKEEYLEVAMSNPVAAYNYPRLFFR